MDITRTITNRILKFAEAAKRSGLVLDDNEFAAAGGMTFQQLYLIRREENRNFTVEQLSNFGKRFNLDMNYIFFGAGSVQLTPKVDASVTEILKYAILKLEEGERGKDAFNKDKNVNAKKSLKNK